LLASSWRRPSWSLLLGPRSWAPSP
jgi:hypothetical protein